MVHVLKEIGKYMSTRKRGKERKGGGERERKKERERKLVFKIF